jgi:lipid-A-disaccharide synthase-like uncharacterized protein
LSEKLLHLVAEFQAVCLATFVGHCGLLFFRGRFLHHWLFDLDLLFWTGGTTDISPIP